MTTTVVGAVVLADGRVLAVRRARPPSLAGRWEFPGGKVEAGESATDAVRRELREELELDVRVGPELGRGPIDADRVLVLIECAPLAGSAARLGRDHDRLRWLRGDELTALDWLDADRALLPAVLGAVGVE